MNAVDRVALSVVSAVPQTRLGRRAAIPSKPPNRQETCAIPGSLTWDQGAEMAARKSFTIAQCSNSQSAIESLTGQYFRQGTILSLCRWERTCWHCYRQVQPELELIEGDLVFHLNRVAKGWLGRRSARPYL